MLVCEAAPSTQQTICDRGVGCTYSRPWWDSDEDVKVANSEEVEEGKGAMGNLDSKRGRGSIRGLPQQWFRSNADLGPAKIFHVRRTAMSSPVRFTLCSHVGHVGMGSHVAHGICILSKNELAARV